MKALLSLAVALVSLLAFAGAVAAKAPDRFPNEPTVLGPDALAETCEFPVELVDTFAAGTTKVFPADADGDQRVLFTGGFRSTITNLDTGESIDVKYFSRIRYVFHPDGTVDVSATGGTINIFSADDVHATLGRGLFPVHGNSTARLDAETFLLLEPDTIRGRVFDICAALS